MQDQDKQQQEEFKARIRAGKSDEVFSEAIAATLPNETAVKDNLDRLPKKPEDINK